jgi:hypothetical protein
LVCKDSNEFCMSLRKLKGFIKFGDYARCVSKAARIMEAVYKVKDSGK